MDKKYADRSKAELQEELAGLKLKYKEFVSRQLKLDMSRGKPGGSWLDLNSGVLGKLADTRCENGTDARNYGVLEGIDEIRRFFGEVLDIDPERIIVGGNSSLNMMYDTIMRLFVFGINGNPPWRNLPKVKFLCPAPGYDRHFAVTQEFGFELITVPMTAQGPDMDVVEELVADPAVKGIWCVPLYSNPEGVCYSDTTVKRLSEMRCAAPDFKIFWDNAYGVHHLYGVTPLKDIFTACEAAGNPERPYYFFSTSKITYPGAGVAMMACGYNDRKEILKRMSIQTIGSDKLNQLRTLAYLKNAQGLKEHMEKLAANLRPKFELVLKMLEAELGGTGLATWHSPKGGYFVALDTLNGCAKATVKLMKEGGVVMTGAGATFPYKNDPNDRNIRIAPTYPPESELELAMELFCICVKIAGIEKLLESK